MIYIQYKYLIKSILLLLVIILLVKQTFFIVFFKSISNSLKARHIF